MSKKLILGSYRSMIIWFVFTILSLRYGYDIWRGGDVWQTGDWLINYSDGFIRRGFLGAVLYWFSDFGVSLLWLTFGLQIIIYGLMFTLVSKLYKTSERSLFWLLILFSPAFLLFPFYHAAGGFRKEILVLTLFAYFSLLYAKSSVTNSKVIWIIVFYLLAGLSHEVTVFVLPFFIFVLWQCVETSQLKLKYAIWFSVIFILISFFIISLSYLFKGSVESASVICNSLVHRSLDPNICTGAIFWLHKDASGSFQHVVDLLNGRSFSVLQYAFLAFVPIAFTSFWNKGTLILLVVSVAFMVPLFILAIDWGRWIYILTFMFYCLLLSSKVTVKLPFQFSYLIFGLFYLTTWSIPHCCVGGAIGSGIFGIR